MAISKFKNAAIRFVMVFFVFIYLFNSFYTVQSIEYTGTNKFYSDYEGFYIVNVIGNRSILYKLDSNGYSTKLFGQSFIFTYAYIENNYIYMITQRDKSLALTKISTMTARETYVMISDFQLRDKCLCVDTSGQMYAVDKRNQNTIVVCYISGDRIDEINVSEKVNSLFYYSEKDQVFAVTDDSIINVKEGVKIKCEIPAKEYHFCGDLCSDSEGNVYRFEPDKGFEKILITDYRILCLAEDCIYTADGSVIYRLDNVGEIISYYDTGEEIDELLASGSTVAYVYDNSIDILNTKHMVSISESSAEEKSSEEVSRLLTSQKSEVSQEFNYDIKSSEVEISGEFIFLNEEMTLAKLKKAIEYHDNTLTVKNHNGKNVTSGKVGTNWELTFSGAESRTYYTVFSGDITGEGSVNSRDVDLMCSYLFDNTEFSPAQAFAADIDENEKIDLLDMYILYKNS